MATVRRMIVEEKMAKARRRIVEEKAMGKIRHKS